VVLQIILCIITPVSYIRRNSVNKTLLQASRISKSLQSISIIMAQIDAIADRYPAISKRVAIIICGNLCLENFCRGRLVTTDKIQIEVLN